MIEGILKTKNQTGTFLLPLSISFHHFSEHRDIAYFVYIVPP